VALDIHGAEVSDRRHKAGLRGTSSTHRRSADSTRGRTHRNMGVLFGVRNLLHNSRGERELAWS